jgi:hypothetical protein
MNENVNYEDNLFFLSQMIGLAEKSVKLKLDNNFFYSKIVDDIHFIDRTLQFIFKDLSENNYLINRNQYLHSLMKKKNRFISLLESLENPVYENNTLTIEDRVAFTRYREIHRGDIVDIREILSLSDSRDEGRDIISNDELNFLMAPGLLSDEED